ncbi:uncharacterized protein LOC143304254 isoform X7 [Bombus vancouverensis nearcticus]|uniref:uncharacterized protein LOC143304254 isoform X7 n=1 Tax=Bombus vancouverensis nearcticus TaxID=2705178 RepID=UPI00402B8E38
MKTRSNKYLQKSSISRICAVGGFFISIPVFLTGMILYTFIQFHSTPVSRKMDTWVAREKKAES